MQQPPHHAPPPAFGLATATFVVVSSMVGTGVLTTSGFTVYFTGSNQLMLLLWVVGGVLAACGALSLCELAAALPRSGGDYVYLREAYGPLAAFLSGWVSFLIGFGGPIAASASAAEEFLRASPDSPDLRRVAALARLRTGKPADGLAIWPGDGDENRWRALHVALLRASDRTKDAEAAAREIDASALGPDDKDLMSGHTPD